MSRKTVMLLAGLVLVVAGIVVGTQDRGGEEVEAGTPHPELARIEPIVISFDPDRIGVDIEEGMNLYRAGRWAEAADALEKLTQGGARARDGEVLLYLGSAHLMEGDFDEAIPKLVRALADAPDPDTEDEIRWQLANAQLAAGRTDTRILFERIEDAGLARSGDAKAILAAMDAE